MTAAWAAVPARHVSGYLMMVDRIEQEVGHARGRARPADLGCGLRYFNRTSPDERHVRVATGA
ncbi:hypothetical protein [Novosphingobium sp.]|uniref:hypothetical protein n=1 Tax=Novosphingobium sp. TaxID=1874826 RepID=UPI001ED01DFB|nr:hypothetical protein [Novosphingobium sp.]MBK9011261.1 hypothetical protein [Novosphingobium sp.]